MSFSIFKSNRCKQVKNNTNNTKQYKQDFSRETHYVILPTKLLCGVQLVDQISCVKLGMYIFPTKLLCGVLLLTKDCARSTPYFWNKSAAC